MRFLQVYIVAVVVVACSLFPARQNLFCAAQESSKQSGFGFKNNDPLLIDGPLKKISDVQDLFELKTVGTKLAPETVPSYQEAQGSVNQIRSITRGGGGSSSSGNGKWTAYFQGREFFGHVANGGVAAHVLARFPNMRAPDNESEFSLWLEELNSPQRVLTVAVGDNDSFSITLRSSELGYLFRFKQEENGRIVCQEMGDQFVFARSAKSFDEFSKRNPEYVQDRLMRVFEFIGVDRPQTRYSSVVTSQVLQMLRPVNEQRMGQFKKAVEEMNASTFSVREAATAEIEKKFDQWQDLIQVGMRDEDFDVETRMRLTRIYKDHVDKKTSQLMKLAQTSKLDADVEYLIWMLGKIDDEPDKMIIKKQLSELTEQDFGFDWAKWVSWFEENSHSEDVAVEKAKRSRIADQSGPLDSASEFVRQLVRFRMNRGELQLDREHWGQPFGNQPIADSVDQVTELMKENSLPLDWLEPGGEFSIESTGFPQVIFENMATRLELEDKNNSRPARIYTYSNGEDKVTRNRVVNTSKITAQMQFHHEIGNFQVGRLFAEGGKNTPPAEKFFCLFIRELTEAKRILEIYESEDETISITLISDESGSVIRLVQHPASNLDVPADRRCVIYDVRDDQSQQRYAATFDGLMRENADYLNTEWLPLMKALGVEVEIPGSQPE